jgi:Spy/CpxP family protein refolding chaperone
MSRKFNVLMSIVLLGVLSDASLVKAQVPGAPGGNGERMGIPLSGPGVEMLGILRQEKFKKEFNLTAEQTSKLAEAEKDLQTNFRNKLSDAKPTSREEAQRVLKEISGQLQAELLAQIKEILQPEQMKRLKEIRLQVIGVSVLLDPEVAGALDLTDEQKSQIRDVIADGRKAVKELTGGDQQLSPEERQKNAIENQDKIKEVVKTHDEKAMEVLTAEQRERLKKMSGKKAD